MLEEFETRLDDPVVFEAEADNASNKATLESALAGVLPQGTIWRVETTNDADLFFVEFSNLAAATEPPLQFEAARKLSDALEDWTFRPVLSDSLIGAARYIDASSSLFSCEQEPQDRGSIWALERVGFPTVWQKADGTGTNVAVIDTGWSDHPDVKNPSVYEFARQLNLIEQGEAKDLFSQDVLFASGGHGTLVASVIASRGGTDSNGVTGPGLVTGGAPGAKVIPIRAIRSVVDIKQSRIARAIDHAVSVGCDVIVMALGGPSKVRSVQRALERARDAGLIVCCAAGNCYGKVVYPARLASKNLCTAVGAVGYNDVPWPHSSRGRQVTVAAPGWDVWGARMPSPFVDDATAGPVQGTTLAVSLTGALAAIWMQHHGGRSAVQSVAVTQNTSVQKLFNAVLRASTSRPPNWDDDLKLGAGVIDASRSLSVDLLSLDGSTISADESEPESILNDPTYARFADELAWAEIEQSALDRATSLSSGTGLPSTVALSGELNSLLDENEELSGAIR